MITAHGAIWSFVAIITSTQGLIDHRSWIFYVIHMQEKEISV